jgi:hypothetical protein
MYEQILFLFFTILLATILLQPISIIDFSQLRIAIKEFEVSKTLLEIKEINNEAIKQIATQLNLSFLSISFRNNTFAFGNSSRNFGNFCLFLNGSLACIEVGIR